TVVEEKSATRPGAPGRVAGSQSSGGRATPRTRQTTAAGPRHGGARLPERRLPPLPRARRPERVGVAGHARPRAVVGQVPRAPVRERRPPTVEEPGGDLAPGSGRELRERVEERGHGVSAEANDVRDVELVPRGGARRI